MFNRIRQIHLFAAFILTAFILMYFITGFVMIFEDTFLRKDNSVREFSKEIPGIHNVHNDTLVALLKKHFDLHGRYVISRNKSQQTKLDFRHPGTETNVSFGQGSDTVNVTIKKKNFVTVMHQFHRLHSYEGGLNYKAWAFLFDLSSLSMIIFALSGVYLWYKVERNRLPGWLVITASTAFMAFTVYYLLELT